MYGGSAIASGGFGCVFKPSIKCKNKKTKKNHVSKLMISKWADLEINDSKIFLNDIKNIKNNNNYFIIPKDVCLPDKLKDEDKVNFDNKCNNLIQTNITSNNVNKNLKNLKIIQLPDGGHDLGNYFENNFIDGKRFIIINNKLIKLLLFGIVKINDKNIYHFDIKSANVLIKEDTIRLIDWGLSLKVTSKFIPKSIKYRPLHYNMPFSIILLNDEVVLYINAFLKKNRTLNQIIDFLYNLYEKKVAIDILGKHHDELIKFILKNHLYPNKNPDLIIFTYMAKVVKHFTENNKFSVEKYFKSVYLKNCDIWGFSTIYLLYAIDNMNNLNLGLEDKDKLKNSIFNIYRNYILQFPHKPIPVNKLSKEFYKLNKLIKSYDKKENRKFNSTTQNFNKNTFLNMAYMKKINKKTTKHRNKTSKANKISKHKKTIKKYNKKK